jgi:tRNA dimethylallyltransferase
MKKQVPKIIVIMGPTASGKSGVAIKLAQKFNGEIISADSRQVYCGMDIGTGKVMRDSNSHQPSVTGHQKYISEGIVHHLIDVAPPMEDFNISHFKTFANIAIEEILAKGKIPIICGGTAFWIDAIVKNTSIPEVAPNIELREKLQQESVEELFLHLQKLDPERAANIDSKNKVRLIRAVEICAAIGKVPAQDTIHNIQNTKYKFLEIGISTEREKLNEKIQKRLDERFDDGMIKEVEDLHKNGVEYEWMERIGLEHRWISRFLQDKVELEEMKKLLYFDIIHYAKRQMTWLKRNKNIIWLEDYQDIKNEVKKFLEK